ncbi:hypothetical protein ACLBXM_06740 [Xanthobacteraceae bacterium A53D]
MSFDDDSEEDSDRCVVGIIRSTTARGGSEGDIHDMLEQITLALLLADEKLFGTSREGSLNHLNRMTSNVARRLSRRRSHLMIAVVPAGAPKSPTGPVS